jgi:hypothetical protein
MAIKLTVPWIVETPEQEQQLREWITEGQWISIEAAIELIKVRFNASPGYARKLWMDARASGEVPPANDDGIIKNPRFDYAVRIDDLEGWIGRHPDKPKPVETRRKARARGLGECRKWLIDLRKSGPQQKTKAEYRADARKLFDVGPDQFRTAWASAALTVRSDEWGKAGRRKTGL